MLSAEGLGLTTGLQSIFVSFTQDSHDQEFLIDRPFQKLEQLLRICYLWTSPDTQSDEKCEDDRSDDKHAGLKGLMTKSPRRVCNQLLSLNHATTISFLSKYILRRLKSSIFPFSRNSLREKNRCEHFVNIEMFERK